MATIKYLLQSKSKTAQVYARLSLAKNVSFKKKTGFVIDFKNWSSVTGFPKNIDAESKRLKNKLKELDVFIIDRYNIDYNKGFDINSDWLLDIINEFNGQKKPSKTEYLIDYGNEFVSKLPNKITDKGVIGVSKDTITKYTTIVKKLKGFEEYKNTKLLIRDVDLQFRDEFVWYLTEVDGINNNTAGRYLSFVKTIVLDARKNGRIVSLQIENFKGFTVSPPIVTLNMEELEKIKAKDYELEYLDIARDWLIIGCYIGQRVSDLLRITSKFIITKGGFRVIQLTQKKTKNNVEVPIHKEVDKILKKRNGEFPPVFSKNEDSNSAIFNRYLKEVCRIAEIDTPTKGNLNNPETMRYETGIYPKWKLISSHTCRRSFATNFYAKEGYPTAMLKAITGHSTEKMFLVYIGKTANDYALQLAKIWEKEVDEKEKQDKQPKFKVIKNATNQ